MATGRQDDADNAISSVAPIKEVQTYSVNLPSSHSDIRQSYQLEKEKEPGKSGLGVAAQPTPQPFHREYRAPSYELSSPPSQSALFAPFRRHRRNASSNNTTSTIPYAEHGALIDRSKTAEDKRPANAALTWPRFRRFMREPLSEFMGTFILLMFGDGSVAQVLLSKEQKGNYESIAWGWVSEPSNLPMFT